MTVVRLSLRVWSGTRQRACLGLWRERYDIGEFEKRSKFSAFFHQPRTAAALGIRRQCVASEQRVATRQRNIHAAHTAQPARRLGEFLDRELHSAAITAEFHEGLPTPRRFSHGALGLLTPSGQGGRGLDSHQ